MPRTSKNRRRSTTPPPARAGSANVFADLGVPHPEQALAKAELARAIAARLDAAGLSQAQAAARLGIDQPKVSALRRGRLAPFSLGRLMRFLTALDADVEIGVRAHRGKGRATIRVRDEELVAA